MSKKRISMRKIKEVLRLKYDLKLKHRQIAKSLNISAGAVSYLVNDAKAKGLTWPLPIGLSDGELEALIYGPANQSSKSFLAPNWEELSKELQGKGMTKQILWQEYQQQSPESAYSYSQFCHHFKAWLKKQSISMRQLHRAGERLFVDYAGPKIPIINPSDGEIREAHVFIAVLGASNYTYAEASYTQALPDWIMAHVRAFEFIEGVPEIIVPDNLRSAVHKACRYEPDLNPTYQQLASYYGCSVIPARPYRPKDKAKVEVAVQIVERQVMMRLRHQTFHSLGALNAALRKRISELNDQPFQKLAGSRTSRFIELDKPALKPLPKQAYQYTEIKLERVNHDYHVELAGHYYSVPYPLIRQPVELHSRGNVLEIYHRHQRVALHVKSSEKGGQSTLPEHRPPKHRYYIDCTPTHLIERAQSIGHCTAQVIQLILNNGEPVQATVRVGLGILHLSKKYGPERLEKACWRALEIGSINRGSIQSILSTGLDHSPLHSFEETAPIEHDNIRGCHYYQSSH